MGMPAQDNLNTFPDVKHMVIVSHRKTTLLKYLEPLEHHLLDTVRLNPP
jgi:hypothetical protein